MISIDVVIIVIVLLSCLTIICILSYEFSCDSFSRWYWICPGLLACGFIGWLIYEI